MKCYFLFFFHRENLWFIIKFSQISFEHQTLEWAIIDCMLLWAYRTENIYILRMNKKCSKYLSFEGAFTLLMCYYFCCLSLWRNTFIGVLWWIGNLTLNLKKRKIQFYKWYVTCKIKELKDLLSESWSIIFISTDNVSQSR